MQQLTQDDKKKLLDSIRTISDYPQPGILFYDITTLLNNPQVFHFIISHLKTHYESFKIDFIAAIESRGLYFWCNFGLRTRSWIRADSQKRQIALYNDF